MALTVTDPIGFPISIGDRWLTIREVDWDNSYPTNGEVLTKSDLGFSQPPDVVLPLQRLGYTFEWDKANEKMKAFYADNNGAADSALIEVANATDLSTVTDAVVLSIGKYRN